MWSAISTRDRKPQALSGSQSSLLAKQPNSAVPSRCGMAQPLPTYSCESNAFVAPPAESHMSSTSVPPLKSASEAAPWASGAPSPTDGCCGATRSVKTTALELKSNSACSSSQRSES